MVDCQSNPANKIVSQERTDCSTGCNRGEGEDRYGRLAAVYIAGMDFEGDWGACRVELSLEGNLSQICGFMKKMGASPNSISSGIYILSWWTNGLVLQINIQRHLIPPSVK